MNAKPAPVSLNDLLSAFNTAGEEIGDLFAGLDAAAFVDGTLEQWSPAHHLDHLIRSNKRTADALSLPHSQLTVRSHDNPARSYSHIRSMYQLELEKGAKAFGLYLPAPTGSQVEIVSTYKESIELLHHDAFVYWTEAELDTRAMPHPVLGDLTVREMLFFTLYHNWHHADRVRSMQEQL